MRRCYIAFSVDGKGLNHGWVRIKVRIRSHESHYHTQPKGYRTRRAVLADERREQLARAWPALHCDGRASRRAAPRKAPGPLFVSPDVRAS